MLSKVFRADELWLRHREEEAQRPTRQSRCRELLRPPLHTLSFPMFLRCHCEEGVSLTRQSSGTIGQPTASSRPSALRPRLDCRALPGSQ